MNNIKNIKNITERKLNSYRICIFLNIMKIVKKFSLLIKVYSIGKPLSQLVIIYQLIHNLNSDLKKILG